MAEPVANGGVALVEEPVANGGTEHLSRNQRRKLAKKRRKEQQKALATERPTEGDAAPATDVPLVVEYVSQKDEVLSDPTFADFAKVFERFASAEELVGAERAHGGEAQHEGASDDETNGIADDEDGVSTALSKKQQKKATRLSVAQLKRSAEHPEVVEQWDVCASDPELLVHLKAYRNAVPIPRHWSQKRAYLQGKRGVEKKPFKLPGTGPPPLEGLSAE